MIVRRVVAAFAALSVLVVGAPAKGADIWHGCGTDPLGVALDQAGARCAEISVPLDYRHPRKGSITVAVARIKASDPGKRRGVLMVNPGGPGGSGMALVLAGALMPDVASRYDIVGMDPRFVGRSTPIHCDWRTDSPVRSAGPTERTFAESVAFAKELAAGCRSRFLPYASTRNTARDMDRVRRVLGERKVSYLGYSYGTYLGAVYLQMFGAHADRVVLDSAVDPDLFGPALFSRSAPAMEKALENWAGWAAGREGFGDTAPQVLDRITTLSRKNPHVLPHLLFAHLLRDAPEAYARLGVELRALEAGQPTEFTTNLNTGSGAAEDRAGTPIICGDRAAERNPETYLRDIEQHRRGEPLFGPMARNILPCAFWPVLPTEAPTAVRNDVPALIVGADGDPATPYAGQLKMHRALTASRMVTLRGRFNHGQFLVAGNGCVDTTVTRYLVDGVRPERDVTCGTIAG